MRGRVGIRRPDFYILGPFYVFFMTWRSMENSRKGGVKKLDSPPGIEDLRKRDNFLLLDELKIFWGAELSYSLL